MHLTRRPATGQEGLKIAMANVLRERSAWFWMITVTAESAVRMEERKFVRAACHFNEGNI
jgi:hypothetical protein